MNSLQVENNVQQVLQKFNKESFIYDFLLAYDTPRSIVKKLKDLALNLSKVQGEVLWKKKLFFKECENTDLHLLIDNIKNQERVTSQSPRFIIVTDYDTLLALDTKNQDSLDISFVDLAKHFDFFLPLAGMEKAQFKSENPADVKAAEKMAKLYDEIKKNNHTDTPEEVHQLNVFLSRLLFCFFAEDTEIFEKGQFTNAIKSHTQPDGSDLRPYLHRLFEVLNTDKSNRPNLPGYLIAFPYVNGGLFRDDLAIPDFNLKSRSVLIECGELNWKDINPDIFGSMIQAVITPEHRGGMGMHYTSVPNIMKVIEPLFLDELKEAFEAAKNQPRKLNELLYRLSKLKIFDPACGSGNFLIIAYKELRLLEIEIIQRLEQLQQVVSGFEEKQLSLIPKAQQSLAAMYHKQLFSNIQLTQFYGVELDDFAHEIAILSLWLAQHQMNMKFKEVLGQGNPTLPLKESGHIVHGNATRLNWEQICPKKDGDEIYILGNPPYLGGKSQSAEQKKDIESTFHGNKNFKELDYIGCWFFLASKYLHPTSKFAFVTTSSICEGSQVEQIWPLIVDMNNEIFFAYSPFNWTNNAKSKAGVTCSIIGVRKRSSQKKYFYNKSIKKQVDRINGYLTTGSEIYVTKRLTSLSQLPPMITGNSPYEGGFLLLDRSEKDALLTGYPQATTLLKRIVGSSELLNDLERWCLWIDDKKLSIANNIPPIKERIEKVKEFRVNGGEVARGLVHKPHQFRYTHSCRNSQVVVPRVSSSRRQYIPISFLDSSVIISDSAQAIYDPELYVFSIISSKMHMLWVRLTSGKLRGDIRYLSALSYNTFPFPSISALQKQELEKHVYRILGERELYPEKTLAQLYDPEKMSDGLQEAHRQNDLSIDRCFRSKPFENDEERLEYLFKLYEEMVAAEQANGTLFASRGSRGKKKKTKKESEIIQEIIEP